ncbi:hypothetical protein D3C84_976580 [compost metagenome]
MGAPEPVKPVLWSNLRALVDLGVPPPQRQVLEGIGLLERFCFSGLVTQAVGFLSKTLQDDHTP